MLTNSLKLKAPIFLISVGKAGTVMLAKIISAIIGEKNYHTPWILSHELSNPYLNFENKFYVGHLDNPKKNNNIITKYKKILLCRDPRDYVVSYAYYMKSGKRPDLSLDRFFRENNYSVENIMIDIIRGIRVNKNVIHNVREIYQRHFFDWANENALQVKYEDLLGNNFGGNDEKRFDTVQKIIDWYEIDVSPDLIREKIVEAADIQKESATFRKGGSGDWKTHFKSYHISLFKEIAPNLLSTLEYEKDENW